MPMFGNVAAMLSRAKSLANFVLIRIFSNFRFHRLAYHMTLLAAKIFSRQSWTEYTIDFDGSFERNGQKITAKYINAPMRKSDSTQRESVNQWIPQSDIRSSEFASNPWKALRIRRNDFHQFSSNLIFRFVKKTMQLLVGAAAHALWFSMASIGHFSSNSHLEVAHPSHHSHQFHWLALSD